MMGNRASARISSAADNGESRALIGPGKARQLLELALRFSAASAREGEGAWLRGREGVLAGVMADLSSGDAIVAQGASRVKELLGSGVEVGARSPAGMKLTDLMGGMRDAARSGRRKNERVTVVFLSTDSVVQEARASAGMAALPLLFVREQRAGTHGIARTNGGIPVIPVDAEDVLALYRVAHESIVRARSGGGPTEIACVEWRGLGTERRNGRAGERVVQRLEQCLLDRGWPIEAWREEIRERRQTAGTANDAGEEDSAESIRSLLRGPTSNRIEKTPTRNHGNEGR